MRKYALITKHSTPYIIIMADTEKELDIATEVLYQNKKMLKSDSDFSKSKFLKNYLRVKLTIEPFN